MRVGGLVVRVEPGQADAVAARLRREPGVEIVHATTEGFAVLMEADSTTQQKERHGAIASWPGVTEALVAFQSNEV